eukprot:1047999-Rhodomonas_salina.1
MQFSIQAARRRECALQLAKDSRSTHQVNSDTCRPATLVVPCTHIADGASPEQDATDLVSAELVFRHAETVPIPLPRSPSLKLPIPHCCRLTYFSALSTTGPHKHSQRREPRQQRRGRNMGVLLEQGHQQRRWPIALSRRGSKRAQEDQQWRSRRAARPTRWYAEESSGMCNLPVCVCVCVCVCGRLDVCVCHATHYMRERGRT